MAHLKGLRVALRAGSIPRPVLWRRCAALTLIGALALLLLTPAPVPAQLGPNLLLAIQQVLNVINQVIQPLLNGIQSIRTGVQGLYEQQIWPQTLIGGAESWFGTIAGLFYQPFETDFLLPVNSATLATPQAFEQALLSRSSGSIGSLGSLYTQLYGPVPPVTQASASARMRMDIDDAMAQDGMKQSLLWDQAQSGNDQAATAIEGLGAFEAPGSAPFHTAAGASAQLRAALLQLRIVSAMLRQEAAKLAEENIPRKESARQTLRLQNDITAAMQ